MQVNNHGIFSLPSGYRIEITPATDKNPMKLFTMNQSGSISHIHSMILPDNTLFIDTTRNTTNQSTGVFITPMESSTRMIVATSTDKSIPG